MNAVIEKVLRKHSFILETEGTFIKMCLLNYNAKIDLKELLNRT